MNPINTGGYLINAIPVWGVPCYGQPVFFANYNVRRAYFQAPFIMPLMQSNLHPGISLFNRAVYPFNPQSIYTMGNLQGVSFSYGQPQTHPYPGIYGQQKSPEPPQPIEERIDNLTPQQPSEVEQNESDSVSSPEETDLPPLSILEEEPVTQTTTGKGHRVSRVNIQMTDEDSGYDSGYESGDSDQTVADPDMLKSIIANAKKGDIKKWIKKGLLDPNAIIDQDRQLRPLHIACEQQNRAAVEALLKADADPNSRSESGLSPLHIAYRLGDKKLAKKLLDEGAQSDSVDQSGKTPLHYLYQHATKDNIIWFLKQAKDVHAALTQKDKAGMTPKQLIISKIGQPLVEKAIESVISGSFVKKIMKKIF